MRASAEYLEYDGSGFFAASDAKAYAGGQVVDRAEFEHLRDLEDKAISGDIRLIKRKPRRSTLAAEGIKIQNGIGVDARLDIHYNPDVGSKVFTVIVPPDGPICRLCVDGKEHKPFGRSHKHSLQTEECPLKNLKLNIVAMPDLSGKNVEELFLKFCEMARIRFEGKFRPLA
jgi:hypothetical protein